MTGDMKGFKLTENGDISITDGQIDMVSGIDLERQTIKTVLGTNKNESPFNADEGIDFRQILGKGVTQDMVKTQIQSGIHQVNSNRNIDDFDYIVDGRKSITTFTARSVSDDSVISDEVSWE